jgi:Fe-Mn family superoxide dismutase
MVYIARDYSGLLGMQGFTDNLLNNHFTLYQGYVNNANKLMDILSSIKDDQQASPQYAELKRRLGWEFNGMRLHEYYFENLGGNGLMPKSSSLMPKLIGEFGSLEAWEKDFRAAGAMRGIGWVILYYDVSGSRLFNQWINEHDVGHLAGCIPILVMDVFEHAYMLDYGLKRGIYIDAFFKNVNWMAVAARLK